MIKTIEYAGVWFSIEKSQPFSEEMKLDIVLSEQTQQLIWNLVGVAAVIWSSPENPYESWSEMSGHWQ